MNKTLVWAGALSSTLEPLKAVQNKMLKIMKKG